MAESFDDLLEQIAGRGLFIINMFQTQQIFPDIRQKTWRCNLMEERSRRIFDVGTGATATAALIAAIEKTEGKTAAASLEDML